ncbi:hypothetical protein [Paenibacillus qinlingensis]|uniref:hypothetical protein n=1 Tax=Paenibacillus qinlingensis TaxID=1837343 RepID=UPI0015671A4B|nr:hypothetical protein [Paenibacillus qinlingensis]NQX59661.1 hypothetical protein [Paenibacillus qinlingensis]
MDNYIFLVLLFALYIGLYKYDWQQMERKSFIWGIVLGSPSLYLIILFLYHPAWPSPGDCLEWIYGSPSDAIVAFFASISGS